MSHLQSGRLEAAARLCSQARGMAPKSFDAHWISGVVALKQERFAEAAAFLRKLDFAPSKVAFDAAFEKK